MSSTLGWQLVISPSPCEDRHIAAGERTAISWATSL
jgi:hypothetical protein